MIERVFMRFFVPSDPEAARRRLELYFRLGWVTIGGMLACGVYVWAPGPDGGPFTTYVFMALLAAQFALSSLRERVMRIAHGRPPLARRRNRREWVAAFRHRPMRTVLSSAAFPIAVLLVTALLVLLLMSSQRSEPTPDRPTTPKGAPV